MENKKEINIIKQEKFLRDIFEGVEKDYTTKLIDFEIDFRHYYILKFNLEPLDRFENKPTPQFKFDIFKNLLTISFQNINYLLVSLGHLSFCTIVYFENNSGEHFNKLMSICDEISALSDNFMPFKIIIGLSHYHESIKNLKVAFDEASESLINLFFSDSNNLVRTPIKNELNNCKQEIDLLLCFI